MSRDSLSRVKNLNLGKWRGLLVNRDRIFKIPRIAFNTKLLLSSWGGANQFLMQFAPYLASRSVEVVYELDPLVTHIFILDVRPIETCTFTINDIKHFKEMYPDVRVINRVNNCDKKYTQEDYVPGYENLDSQMMSASNIATDTIFISNWLRDYFVDKGYKKYSSSKVIQNAADAETFYAGQLEWDGREPLKLVTHHWSDNWMKGYKVYQQIDELIASGELEGFEFTVIGRWPKEIEWKKTHTHGPCQGVELANKLREHHMYITASLWEPGGMHFIEGMQCGLPVVYHEDGGGIPEVASLAGVGFTDDVKSALLKAMDSYRVLRDAVIERAPSGKTLCRKFEEVIF
ncbi:MAG: glycosyltransferase [Bacteroidota bacterium]